MENNLLEASASPLATPVRAYPTLKESWGALGWFLLAIGAVGLPVMLLAQNVAHASKPVVGMVMTLATNLAFLGLLRWKAGKRWRPLQFAGREQVWLYALLPVLVLAMLGVLSVVQLLGLPDLASNYFKELVRTPVVAFLLGVVIAPVLEELVFRGVILQGLLRAYKPWIAIGQSALLFGIIHFNPAQSINAALIGMLLGWLYYRTRSLWLCMTVHALNNLVAFGSMLTEDGKSTDSPEAMLLKWPFAYAGLVLLSGFVLILILRRVQQTTTPLTTDEEPQAPLTPPIALSPTTYNDRSRAV
ncbi:CPBP family intramembrane glutamic endopeptidase [Hymenobacter sp. AT01-02]|uniref:CPBP family intramembrane glutamic endopeptidase n=1 Tax=Hymenobacter sp. AT01-02 TaxID=1571877 RepID=UPI0005F220D6|nr:type II CAAX endopeptidase family protein [Hymenobacter sp. AT01-02]